MEKVFRPILFKKLILEGLRILIDIGNLKQRNGHKLFLCAGFALISLKGFRILYKLFYLIFSKAFLYLCKLIRGLFIILGSKPSFRLQHNHRRKTVFQQMSFYKSFKIAAIHLGSKFLIDLIGFDMDKGLFLIIEPAVQALKSVHKSLWV